MPKTKGLKNATDIIASIPKYRLSLKQLASIQISKDAAAIILFLPKKTRPRNFVGEQPVSRKEKSLPSNFDVPLLMKQTFLFIYTHPLLPNRGKKKTYTSVHDNVATLCFIVSRLIV